MTKIRVRIGTAEAEVEADHEHLRDAIEMIPEVAAKLRGGSNDAVERNANPVEGTPDSNERFPPSALPAVTLEKGDSLADVIGKFFADQWGRERRKLSDVREALQSYGLNYPKQSVAVALLRLAKTSRIRRFKAEDGEYVYTSGVVTFGSAPPKEEATLDELAAPRQG